MAAVLIPMSAHVLMSMKRCIKMSLQERICQVVSNVSQQCLPMLPLCNILQIM